ncbi:uncharacterized protein CCR75_009387 [Bremia lactucae]|uniref:Uncharacterized protein n=1 Tax=Bremia lactucae TaxID=4779 RepID=A0A976FJ33_BRELC|nr:hypothetical protein CCR75_009387 [Bremia lactucae]
MRHRDYGGSSSRYARAGAFSIPDSDFQRGNTTLKRQRHLSPPRGARHTSRRSVPFKGMRARSKSHTRPLARKAPNQEFIPLGSNRLPDISTHDSNKASFHHREPSVALTRTTARARSRSSGGVRQTLWTDTSQWVATGRHRTASIATRTRSKSVTKGTTAANLRSQRERSKSAARRSGGAPISTPIKSALVSNHTDQATERCGTKRARSKSTTSDRRDRKQASPDQHSSRSRSDGDQERAKKLVRKSRRNSRSGSSLEELEDAIADTEKELEPKRKQLTDLQEQLKKMQMRIESKEIEVYDLQVDLEALKKRRDRRLPSHDQNASRNSRSTSCQSIRRRSRSHVQARSRPCIVDEDDEGSTEEDDCIIIDSNEIKKEPTAVNQSTVVPIEDSIPDHFWGRSNIPKLLANHRFRAFPDGSLRKGRHFAFNPNQPKIFATSPDEGGLILWSYERQDQDISKVVTLAPSSFRRENSCAEAIAWSPDGNRMAMAFRDPVQETGEFCIVQLHQLKLEDSNTPQKIPRNRVTSKRTTLHSRGLSAIDWLPTGFGPETTSHRLITTGNSDHAVVLWEEHVDSERSGLDLKFNVLHRDHRSEVKSLCIHSKRQCLYTGGMDGLLIRYDLNKGTSDVVIERRKPNISKINSVLEHPHNPNLLLVSSVESSRYNLILHDLRQRYDSNEMALTWEGSSMSQYVVPRWSPAGYHVSCGSKTGVVNIWDVRMRGESYPKVLPQQSLRVHHKTVLHATWHPRYDAMFSVSHDRTLGLLTFR